MTTMETHRIPPRNLAVREEMGLMGVREQQASMPELLSRGTQNVSVPTHMPEFGGTLGRTSDAANLAHVAEAHQRTDTSRSWAPAPMYPAQMRLHELNREVIPKNHQEFELVGRNIGPHATSNAVGGYAGRDKIGEDVTEKLTQRTHDDFNEYFHPTAAARFNRGAASVYNQFDQNRIEARELGYKDTAGRYPGAFRHDIRRPGHAQDELQQKGQFGALKETMKRDDSIVHRQREDENPNREGLRMQYADVYSPEWNGMEKLITPRRVQHTVEFDIDASMLEPYYTNPYTVPIGIVPHRAQHSEDLNDAAYQESLRGKVPGQMRQ